MSPVVRFLEGFGAALALALVTLLVLAAAVPAVQVLVRRHRDRRHAMAVLEADRARLDQGRINGAVRP
jgi:hypothetical protein